MKNFLGIKIWLYLSKIRLTMRLTNAMFKWFWNIFSLGGPAIRIPAMNFWSFWIFFLFTVKLLASFCWFYNFPNRPMQKWMLINVLLLKLKLAWSWLASFFCIQNSKETIISSEASGHFCIGSIWQTSLVPRRSWLYQSWTLPWAVMSPRETRWESVFCPLFPRLCADNGARERQGTRLMTDNKL